eukprot:5967186-Alexandrium_andersonii.AAC.1
MDGGDLGSDSDSASGREQERAPPASDELDRATAVQHVSDERRLRAAKGRLWRRALQDGPEAAWVLRSSDAEAAL